LAFKLDTVPENAYRINELLAAARSADAEVAERAAGASYAGEPDPYKVPRVEQPPGDEDLVAHAGARSEFSDSAGEFDDDEFDDGEFDDPNASVGHQVR
jgi:ribosome-binding factor A